LLTEKISNGIFLGRRPRQDVKILRRFGADSVPIFRVMTTTFHWVVSPRRLEDLQQMLSEDARCLGYDSVSLGEWLPTKRSACILTKPDLMKIHSCW